MGSGDWRRRLRLLVRLARGRRSGGGALKSPARNNYVAEIMAVVNGVHMAFAHQIAMHGDSLLAQADCQAAILAFEGQVSPERSTRE